MRLKPKKYSNSQKTRLSASCWGYTVESSATDWRKVSLEDDIIQFEEYKNTGIIALPIVGIYLYLKNVIA